MLVQDFLEQSAARAPEKIALVCGDQRLTYAQVEAMANRMANALRGFGVKRGDRVVIYLNNSVETVVAMFGVLKAGGVFVSANRAMKAEKLLYVLNNCQAVALIADARGLAHGVGDRLLADAAALGTIVVCGNRALTGGNHESRWASYANIQSSASAERSSGVNTESDLACLIYTSGTTGESKGVMCDHSNVVFVTNSIVSYLKNAESDVVLNVLPMAFSYGLYQLMAMFRVGGTLLLEESFTFPAAILQKMAQERVTGFAAVPTVYSILLGLDLSSVDLSALRYLTNAAAGLPIEHVKRLRQVLPKADLYLMHGLTEVARTMYLPPDQVDHRPGSSGIAIPGTELWIQDEDGRRLGPGETGELVVRGQHVMRGYWGDPDLTARKFSTGVIPGQRICLSGDLFRTDEAGYFYFVSRKDDIIKSRGEKIAPREVENVLYTIRGVQDAAVIGVPDPMLGQAIKAFIVAPGANLTEAKVISHCKAHLEEIMVPRRVEFRDELPKTGSGKVREDGFTIMCGIAGMFDRKAKRAVAETDMRQMLAMLRHRGPDEFGILLDHEAGLGNARLSIIDLSGGSQPIANEDESLWIVFNGEIFNYVELRPELEARGHKFRTSSDTEVILHLYEEYGPKCLEKMNGQFAIAIWDKNRRQLFLARDRLGVRPLFYTEAEGTLLFASEIKSILSDRRVRAEIDPAIVEQVFRFWAPLSPNTIFRDIKELPPGHFLVANRESVQIEQYWRNQFPPEAEVRSQAATNGEINDTIEEFRALLIDACKVRLRADVPVGVYLSGGLDSSAIASVVRNHTSNRLVTFSIAFTDVKFDESQFQQEMAAHLGTDHHVVRATHGDIGRVFPEVVWHTEVPIMRTSPAPMFMLSKLVRDTGFKVVLTGEGADEFLAGYDIFKEAKVRRFWAGQPQSKFRPQLFKRLYPDITGLSQSNVSYLSAFFGEGLGEVDSPLYSHAIRWRNNRRTRRFFADAVLAAATEQNYERVAASLPADFKRWGPLAQAQYLEITIFLSQYLLSSQGDRMGMANSIEGRFPFLDVRLVEFCNRLDSRMKLRCLREKWLLKQAAKPWLPSAISKRPKRPYRAPVHKSFFNDATPDYVREMLSPSAIRETGIFKTGPIDQLVSKIDGGAPIGETDDMALVGILSTQLVHHNFIKNFRRTEPLSAKDRVKVCRLN